MFHINFSIISTHYVFYHARVYYRIGYQNMGVPHIPKHPIWTITYPFKAEDDIYCYITSHLKDYQPYRNFLIMRKHSPCNHLVKSSAVMILLCGFKIYYELLIQDHFYFYWILLGSLPLSRYPIYVLILNIYMKLVFCVKF